MAEETEKTLSSCLDGLPMIKLQEGGQSPVLNYQTPQKTAITAYGETSMGLDDSYFTDEAKKVPEQAVQAQNQTQEEIITIIEQNPPGDSGFTGDLPDFEDERLSPAESELGEISSGINTDSSTVPTTSLSNLYAYYGWDTAYIAQKIKEGFAPRIVYGLGRFRPRLFFYLRPVQPTDPTIYTATPQLYFVEEYVTVSFLGDYGAGKTLKMHSLFPGESTKITITTFQEIKTVKSRAKNIVDSFSEESAKEMENLVENEATQSTSSSKEKTSSASANVGFRIGGFGGGGKASTSTTTKSSRENNTKNLSKALSKHVDKSNSSREVTVNTTTEESQTNTEEVATVREFSNPNQSRVLNYVFRELVQEYVSITYLNDLKIGFGNGHPEFEEVFALEDLGILLEKYVVPEKHQEIRQRILHNYASVDNGVEVDRQVNFIEEKSYPEFGTGNPIPYLSKRKDVKDSYQIKEGHVEEVDGVVLNVDRNVLRTPAVIVDALLGQGEALDCFNAQGQEAKMQIEKLEAKKLDLALQALEAITDPVQRAEMYAKMFNPPTNNNTTI